LGLRDEVTGEWRKLQNEKLNDLYPSSNIVRVIKWRRMGWAGHVARMGTGRHRQGFGGETGQVAGACECGNEPSGSMKCAEFLD
jgi:hypothetical protein